MGGSGVSSLYGGPDQNGENWESGELAISLNGLLQTTRFNEAEARVSRMRESTLPTCEAWPKIAAAFEVNQARISEILVRKRFPAANRLAENTGRDRGSIQR
jgi:hypothetical protein